MQNELYITFQTFSIVIPFRHVCLSFYLLSLLPLNISLFVLICLSHVVIRRRLVDLTYSSLSPSLLVPGSCGGGGVQRNAYL